MEDWLRGKELCKDAPYGPDVNGFGVVPGSEQKLWGPIPKGHNHWVQVCQGLEGRVEESGKKTTFLVTNSILFC